MRAADNLLDHIPDAAVKARLLLQLARNLVLGMLSQFHRLG